MLLVVLFVEEIVNINLVNVSSLVKRTLVILIGAPAKGVQVTFLTLKRHSCFEVMIIIIF